MSAPQSIIDEVTSKVSPDTYPKLTAPEIAAAIEATLRAQVWTPSVAVDLGHLVTPTSRNGVIWRAIVSGTTGTVEPDWELIWDPFYPWVFQDNTVYWQVGGVDTMETLYDARRAIHDLWLIKAGRATGDFSYSNGDAGSANPSTIADNCRKQANLYKSFFVR